MDPQRAVGFTGQPAYPAPECRMESAYQLPSPTENLESVGRSTVNQWLAPSLRNASLPADFKAPRKLANYTADMDSVVWMESYELDMDLLRASDGVCARYFMMMLEGAGSHLVQESP